MTKIAIGTTLYVFDQNRRHYAPGRNGPPIYAEHFRPHKVVGETRVSWILDGDGIKVSKKDGVDFRTDDHFPKAFTEEGKRRAVWMDEHRQKLAEFVRDRATFEQMQAVAKMAASTNRIYDYCPR